MRYVRFVFYLLKHKWFILYSGNLLYVPLWRLLIHDLSKLSPVEFTPFADYHFGPWEEGKQPARVVSRRFTALAHHFHANPHHWQYWLLVQGPNDIRPLEMPAPAVAEMVADWAAAGRAKRGSWDLQAWYAKEKGSMILHPNTRILAEVYMDLLMDAIFPGEGGLDYSPSN